MSLQLKIANAIKQNKRFIRFKGKKVILPISQKCGTYTQQSMYINYLSIEISKRLLKKIKKYKVE